MHRSTCSDISLLRLDAIHPVPGKRLHSEEDLLCRCATASPCPRAARQDPAAHGGSQGGMSSCHTNCAVRTEHIEVQPIWSVSQVNRAGAQDNIIEGDKAAGSYDKMMIADFAMSLSRKKEDKVNGTGRYHIMKNRYGTDGLTFMVNADTSTGHFEVSEYHDNEDDSKSTPKQKSNSFDDVDAYDKGLLRKKFFELND